MTNQNATVSFCLPEGSVFWVQELLKTEFRVHYSVIGSCKQQLLTRQTTLITRDEEEEYTEYMNNL